MAPLRGPASYLGAHCCFTASCPPLPCSPQPGDPPMWSPAQAWDSACLERPSTFLSCLHLGTRSVSLSAASASGVAGYVWCAGLVYVHLCFPGSRYPRCTTPSVGISCDPVTGLGGGNRGGQEREALGSFPIPFPQLAWPLGWETRPRAGQSTDRSWIQPGLGVGSERRSGRL